MAGKASRRPRRQAARQEPAGRLADPNKDPQAEPSDVHLAARTIVRNNQTITIVAPTVLRAMAMDAGRLRQAEELVARQAELQAAEAAGGELVYSEAGICVSQPPPGRRPAFWPEGGPLLRGGRWV